MMEEEKDLFSEERITSACIREGKRLTATILQKSTDSVVTKKKVVNLKAQRYGQVFVTEFVATALLVFMACMGCTSGISGDALSPIQAPLTSGFAVATLVQTFGHISDCHMNPAVTMCFLSRGLIDIPMSIVYIIAELLGAASGYGMLVALLPKGILAVNPEHCMTLVHSEMSNTNGALFEFVMTSVLIFLICGLLDARNSSKQDSAPIKFGLCITCLSFIGGTLTGASLNPARSFGPALWNNSWSSHWVYWFGPMFAGLVVPKFYQFLFEKDLKSAIEQ